MNEYFSAPNREMSDFQWSLRYLKTMNKKPVVASRVDDDISEILPGQLYLGTWGGAGNYRRLTSLNVKGVLCLNWERKQTEERLQKYKELGIETLSIEIKDAYDSKMQPHFEPCYRFIQRQLQIGAVYIHCTAGICRSPTIAIYYMIRRLYEVEIKMSLQEKLYPTVYTYVNLKRYGINPLVPFIQEIEEAETEMQQARLEMKLWLKSLDYEENGS
jgi:hypothetical protein